MTHRKEIYKILQGQVTSEDLEEIARLGSCNIGFYARSFNAIKNATKKIIKKKGKNAKR